MSSLVTLRGADAGGACTVIDRALLVEPKTEWQQAVENGKAFSWGALTADIDATDTLLAVENNSNDYDLVIERIVVSTDAAGQFVVWQVSGNTQTGTALVGVNLNRNSSYVAPATAKGDETGNGQAAATYTGRLLFGWLANDVGVDLPVNGGIVLPYDYTIGVDLTAEPTGGTCTIFGYFRAV